MGEVLDMGDYIVKKSCFKEALEEAEALCDEIILLTDEIID